MSDYTWHKGDRSTVPLMYRRLDANGLRVLPTLSQGQADDLKIETEHYRVWLCRCGIADGMPANDVITVERYDGTRWRDAFAYSFSEPDDDEPDEPEDDDEDDGYSWSDASALWQIANTPPETVRHISAREYLERRLAMSG